MLKSQVSSQPATPRVLITVASHVDQQVASPLRCGGRTDRGSSRGSTVTTRLQHGYRTVTARLQHGYITVTTQLQLPALMRISGRRSKGTVK